MNDEERARRREARRDRMDAWFLRIASIISALFLVWMLQQAFTMKPVERPAAARTMR